MKGLPARRARLERVREVQHAMAIGEASAARDQAAQIAENARRLAQVRVELFGRPGSTLAGALASSRELADRLLQAGRQLDGALYDAHRTIDHKDAAARIADREREIAARLKDKAHRAAEDRVEAGIQALPAAKRMGRKGTERS